jgi:endonuclease YncB( thermonuclease family)
MATGFLEVSGTLDVNQFWPKGESDGDTAKVVVGAGAFRFRAKPNGPWKVTRAFDQAMVKRSLNARSGTAAINKKQQITVRWQGIDAPELHYRPTPEKLSTRQKAALKKVNGNFRQFFGESSTVALARYLTKLGKNPVPVVVRTAVDTPSDVFDMYGRFIGDIYVKIKGKEVDLNHWMLQQGWAFPTLYASMSPQEIKDVLALADKAKARKAGLWKYASSVLKGFNAKLLFVNHGTFNAAEDVGPVIMPKQFRRLSTYSVEKKAKITDGTFPDYLKAHPDGCYETKEFLEQGATSSTHRRLDEFVSKQSVFLVGPGDLVFQESGSVTVGKNGKPAKW